MPSAGVGCRAAVLAGVTGYCREASYSDAVRAGSFAVRAGAHWEGGAGGRLSRRPPPFPSPPVCAAVLPHLHARFCSPLAPLLIRPGAFPWRAPHPLPPAPPPPAGPAATPPHPPAGAPATRPPPKSLFLSPLLFPLPFLPLPSPGNRYPTHASIDGHAGGRCGGVVGTDAPAARRVRIYAPRARVGGAVAWLAKCMHFFSRL